MKGGSIFILVVGTLFGILVISAVLVDRLMLGSLEFRMGMNTVLIPGSLVEMLITREPHTTFKLDMVIVPLLSWLVWMALFLIVFWVLRRAMKN